MSSKSELSTWLDRAVGYLAPVWGLNRIRARAASTVLARHYEAAASGRRTQGWHRGGSDVNAAAVPSLASIRNAARDLVRNNGQAANACDTIADHVVGWGITPKPKPVNARALDAWRAWAETTDCDAEGRHDFAGIQHLVMNTVVESGECLVRIRRRLPVDGLALPLQLQVLEPDYLDTSKEGKVTSREGRVTGEIYAGIEFDPLGRRVAYWMFREHPGSASTLSLQSTRVPVSSVLHVFRTRRPGQVRGVSWFAPVLMRFKDFDEYEDAQLMKQKIAACLAVLVSDPGGAATPLGKVDPNDSTIDMLEPGLIRSVPQGQSIEVVQPPRVGDYGVYAEITLRAIATGLGLTYEDFTGDYTDLPFSAARMSRLRHWARVEGWRWKMLVPQLCEPVWRVAMQAAAVAGKTAGADPPEATWTAPPMPMIDPSEEGLAYMRNVRSGIMSLSEALRERGYDPEEVLKELSDDMSRLDKLGLVLDSDPRKMTQSGQAQSVGGAEPEPGPGAPAAPAPETEDEGQDDGDDDDEDDEDDDAESAA